MANALPQKPSWWPEGLIDENRTAELIGLTVPTLRDWRCRKTRALPYVKLGAAVRYNPDALWEWVNRNTVRPMVCA
jgi:hypothetical protein